MASENFNNFDNLDSKETNIYNENSEKQLINEFSLKTINQFFLRRKKVISLSFLILFFVFFTKTIYTRFTAPIYQANFSLLIIKESLVSSVKILPLLELPL